MPHKKRIPTQLNAKRPVLQLEKSTVDKNIIKYADKVTPEKCLVSLLICELCGYNTESQLKFYLHLKLHYEPATMANIINVENLKTETNWSPAENVTLFFDHKSS